MITARVSGLSLKRLNELSAELKYLSSASFVRSLPLRDFRERALSYLRTVFPVSSGPRRFNDPVRHLVYGWKHETLTAAQGVAIRLFHVDEKEPHIRTILRVLDKGSKAYTWSVREDFVFFGKRANGSEGFVTFEEGRVISQPSRAGTQYSDKTLNHIRTKLMPEMRAMIHERIASRLKRIR